MPETILGTRIRERRKQTGVTQSDLAHQIGISASYLNLIERNKRRIAGQLLTKTAAALGVGLDELDGAAERRLLDRLGEIAKLPHLGAHQPEADAIGEMIGRFPGWSRTLAMLAQSERDANNAARVLADRLTHDPFFAESVHGMLTRISSVRSAAEILCEYDDIPEDRRKRFLTMIRDESTALSSVGEALAAYFDKLDETDRTLTPLDEVEALFDRRKHHFQELEEAASKLADQLRSGASTSRLQDAARLSEQMAQAIDHVVSSATELETAAGRTRAQRALKDYAIAAILIPLAELVKQAPALGYDIEALAEAFGAPVEIVCRRLLALPRQSGMPMFGYFRSNAAGTIIEMHGLRNLPVPRYTAACPLWILYRAQQAPETVLRQRVLFPTGARFVFVARARSLGETGFGKPKHFVTDMLVASEEDAHLTVYASDSSVPLEEVGPACRLCPRTACMHRIDDPLTE